VIHVRCRIKLILLGNAGAGKSTMARRVIGDRSIPRLSLDEIAWDAGPKRKPLPGSVRMLHEFIRRNDEWIIEGCYGDLIEAALLYCTELRFLNPGIDVCVAHCNRRPWEPEKFSSPEDQKAMLDHLIEWVKQYETRDDEYGLKRHRRIFDGFTGTKHEYTSVLAYSES
jgi:adenylate kinase family enzyme